MSKKQLEVLITKPKRSKIPIPISRPKKRCPQKDLSLREERKSLYVYQEQKTTIEDNIIKNIRNLFGQRKENEAIKDVRNLFKLKKNKKAITRDIRNLFESEKEDYYKPARVGNFHSKNYIDFKSNGNKNKAISIKDYLEQTKPYKTSDSYKIQLTI